MRKVITVIISWWLTGPEQIETNQFKKVYGEVYARFLDQKILVDLYGDYERTNLAPNYHKDKTTFKFCVTYMSDAVSGGVEVLQQMHTMNAIATDTATIGRIRAVSARFPLSR